MLVLISFRKISWTSLPKCIAGSKDTRVFCVCGLALKAKYTHECLKMINFGPSIRKWGSLFFSNREACILLGGELTKTILLEQGVPQGDAVLPYIFIFFSMFADYTSICIKRDPTYLRRCLEFFKHFARFSGLQCNLEKTAVIPIGGNYDINDKPCTE